MAVDAATLLSEANCFNCYGSNPFALQLMKLALLRQLVLQGNAMAAVTPQQLMEQANCFNCYASNPYMLQLMELGLLVQVVNNGGGGGGSGSPQVFEGSGPPSGLQPGMVGTVANVYRDTDPGGFVYWWNVAAQDWS